MVCKPMASEQDFVDRSGFSSTSAASSLAGTHELAFTGILQQIRRLLPQQNPLHAFVHNNMLMAWEGYEFWGGAQAAADLYGARFPKPLQFYQAAAQQGRIRHGSLVRALRDVCHDQDLWLAQSTEAPLAEEQLACTLLLRARAHAADPLLQALKDLKPRSREAEPRGDRLVLASYPAWQRANRPAFPGVFGEWFCGLMETYLDQGLSRWPNPFQRHGLLVYAARLAEVYRDPSWGAWAQRLHQGLASVLASKESPSQYLCRQWQQSGVSAGVWRDYLLGLAFTFKGWLGQLQRMEEQPELQAFVRISPDLVEGLTLVYLAAQVFGLPDAAAPCWQLAPSQPSAPMRRGGEQLCTPAEFNEAVASLTAAGGEPLCIPNERLPQAVGLLNKLDSWQSLRALHLAYEDSLYMVTLQALQAGDQGQSTQLAAQTKEAPAYQVLTCLDDRQESLRRYIEEVAPEVTTAGVLGNFALGMKFVSQRHPKPRLQCPPGTQPCRVVIEQGARPRGQKASWLASWQAASYFSTRGLLGGLLGSLILGTLAFVPLFFKVSFPNLASRLRKFFVQRFFAVPSGSIDLTPQRDPQFGEVGYSWHEQAGMVASILEPAGMAGHCSRMVLVLGHQATSANNPFIQAYGCGACSGHSGAPNARAFAGMANHPRVRQILADDFGCRIEPSTVFIAAVHDTTSDEVFYFPPCDLSAEQQQQFAGLRAILDQARKKNAWERVQFFDTAPAKAKTAEKGLHRPGALAHVYQRAFNLAEPRPEYGHSRVAMAIFGDRKLTKNTNLDRRAFLVSYDPEADGPQGAQGAILKALIEGAMPVVANIGLDYFFSAMDAHGFGAGSKLPLNISALLGVVSGSRSDLRLGLAQQMVEGHEPVRIIAVVAAPPAQIAEVIFAHPRLGPLVANGWLRLIAWEVASQEFFAWADGQWRSLQLGSGVQASLTIAGSLQRLSVLKSGAVAASAAESMGGVQ